MKGLTGVQAATLDFIVAAINGGGFPPSLMEIAEKFNLSTAGAYLRVEALERKGYVTRTRNARSIRPTGKSRK